MQRALICVRYLIKIIRNTNACFAVIGASYLMPGAMKLKDLDGDGKVTVADRTIIGNASPDVTGGFNISAYIKGVDFSANFNYMIGNQV